MGTIDSALYTRLSGYAGLSALVSTRIYPPPVHQNEAAPYVTYQEISRVPIHGMGTTHTLTDIRYQIDCWAETLAGAKAVAKQVKAALDNYHGTSDGVVIANSFLQYGTSMDYSPDEGVHRYMQEYVLQYEEP